MRPTHFSLRTLRKEPQIIGTGSSIIHTTTAITMITITWYTNDELYIYIHSNSNAENYAFAALTLSEAIIFLPMGTPRGRMALHRMNPWPITEYWCRWIRLGTSVGLLDALLPFIGRQISVRLDPMLGKRTNERREIWDGKYRIT